MPRHVERGNDTDCLLTGHEEDRVRESMDNCTPRWSIDEREAQWALVDGQKASGHLLHELPA
jgi:hypothetical protein